MVEKDTECEVDGKLKVQPSQDVVGFRRFGNILVPTVVLGSYPVNFIENGQNLCLHLYLSLS